MPGDLVFKLVHLKVCFCVILEVNTKTEFNSLGFASKIFLCYLDNFIVFFMIVLVTLLPWSALITMAVKITCQHLELFYVIY